MIFFVPHLISCSEIFTSKFPGFISLLAHRYMDYLSLRACVISIFIHWMHFITWSQQPNQPLTDVKATTSLSRFFFFFFHCRPTCKSLHHHCAILPQLFSHKLSLDGSVSHNCESHKNNLISVVIHRKVPFPGYCGRMWHLRLWGYD